MRKPKDSRTTLCVLTSAIGKNELPCPEMGRTKHIETEKSCLVFKYLKLPMPIRLLPDDVTLGYRNLEFKGNIGHEVKTSIIQS